MSEEVLSLLTDPVIREILGSHSRVYGYANFQKRSFNHFMDVLLPHIVREHSKIVYDSKSTQQRHIVEFGRLTMVKPNHREADGKVSMLLPEEARARQLDYCLPVLMDVTHDVYKLPTDPNAELEPLEARRVYREVPFCEMPVMLQSKYCHLDHRSRVPVDHWDGSSMKRPQAECPYDEGGYFIVRGLERSLQVQESLRNNLPVIFPMKQPYKYWFVCETRSRHESKMRSTSTLQVYVTARKGGAPPEILLSLPFLPSLDVPLIMILRLLGFEDHAQLMRYIVTDAAMNDPTHPDARLVPLVRAVLSHTSNRMSVDEVYEYIGKEGTRDSGSDARQRYVLHLLANELLPHLGFTSAPEAKHKKAVYLCIIVRRLLRAYCDAPMGFRGTEAEGREIAEVDDRDHYANKRLSLSGTMLALLFRQLMRQFVKNLRRYLYVTIENNKYLNVGDAVNNRKISASLRFAFRTGNWSTQRSTGTHVGITQVIHRMSHIALQSQIRRVNTPICREGKATHLRQAHVSHWGILCPSETPEGSSCGLVKNLSVMAYVRIGTPADMICHVLYTQLGVVPFSDIPDAANCSLVFVNGDIVGACADATALVCSARRARRSLNLPFDTSVVTLPNGVMIHTDGGCCLRPVFVVENLSMLPEALEHANATPSAQLWNVLLHRGIIEYLDKDEEVEMRVAVTPEELLREPAGSYTHMEIHPTSILGHCAMQIPYSHHNQAPRNIYQASMGKQAVAVPSLAYHSRLDSQMHVPYYTQRPLVQTGAEIPDFGMGINAVVAIMMYTGNNQEDSIIMNKAFVERGGFRSSYYTVYNAEERNMGADTECFENPTQATECVGMKQADYSLLDSMGTVPVGSGVVDGSAIIGKTMSTPRFHGGRDRTVKRDRSTIFQSAEGDCRVDQVMMTTNRDGLSCQRVRIRTPRVPIVGDKFCLSPDHDVLTRNRGWVAIPEVTMQDEVACLNGGTELMYLRPVSIVQFEHFGRMYSVSNEHVDLLVTPEHKMFVRPVNESHFQLIRAQDLSALDSNVEYKRGAVNMEPDLEETPVGVPMHIWLQIFGRYWSGGGCVTSDRVRVPNTRATPHFKHVLEPLELEGVCTYATVHAKAVYFSSEVLGRALADVSRHSPFPAWVWRLSARQAGELCRVVQAWDIPEGVRGEMQRLHLHAQRMRDSMMSSTNGRTESYAGMVHCLEVPTHVFYVRRNGKTVWTGNSSRHGQKGTVGILLPQEDMPFSMQTGISPDIIVNPCAIPSRMTIAHLVECIASKTGAILGKVADGMAFRKVSVESISDMLHQSGYQRHGNERLVNGMTGELMEAAVFMGPTFYQKLKHMTYDKVHSRTTGPRTIMTRQPVEGRARKGGLRLGEMEKDCFVSHGASRVLLERMLYASDAYRAPMCTTCGLVAVNKHNSDFGMNIRGQKAYCRVCDGNVEDITMPFVYKLLLSELNAVGITVHHEFNEMIPADGPLPDGAVGAAAASVKSI